MVVTIAFFVVCILMFWVGARDENKKSILFCLRIFVETLVDRFVSPGNLQLHGETSVAIIGLGVVKQAMVKPGCACRWCTFNCLRLGSSILQ